MAHASKACGRKSAEVQILYPPPSLKLIYGVSYGIIMVYGERKESVNMDEVKARKMRII